MHNHKLKINLIDDDEDDYILIRALLGDVKGSEFELEWVATYDEGLEVIKRQQHDVYLIDYRLGERNGLELLCEAIEAGCRKPIILLTGQGDYEIDMEAMRFGAADYLEKEWVDGHLLERAIRYAIERKQAEEDLRRARDEWEEKVDERTADLRSAHAELEQLTYVASHDLQEPLRAIEGVLQLLTQQYKGKLGGEVERLMGRAVDGVTIIQRLSNRLLAYAGVSRHGKPFEPTDCSAVLTQVLEDLKDVIEEGKVVVTCDDLPEVGGDPDQLGQVFRHLIGNAINHRGEGSPQIHIGADHKGDAWVFSVRDNGLGIDPRNAEQLFYLFSPFHSKMGNAGTGISLAVCKKIVERHGGRIWVEGATGEGSKFCFSIPAETQ